MRGVRRARLGVDHLLRVSVVRGDEQDVARLLARLVHRPDRRVSMRDRLDGSVVHARVADLRACTFSQSLRMGKKGGGHGWH